MPGVSLARGLQATVAMSIEKVLVAVDFSDESEVAVKQALDIARQQGASLTLLHVGVVPEQPVGIPSSMQTTVNEYMSLVNEHLAADRKRLQTLNERISGQGAEISQMVLDGIPADGIPKAAAEVGADLVITGTHGRTGVKRFFLGSVAEKVVRLSQKSVLVARSLKDESGGYKRMLVATDFSETSERALEMAVSLARPGAVIDVLHCWYLPPLSYPYYAPTKSASDLIVSVRESIVASNAKRGAELIGGYQDAGCEISFHLLESAPAPGIQERLEKHEYDLVVMGSHGRRGARRLLLGSVAELTVRHAPCSVLVVHDPAQAAKE